MTTKINDVNLDYYLPIMGTVLSLVAWEGYQNYFEEAHNRVAVEKSGCGGISLGFSNRETIRLCEGRKEIQTLAQARTYNNLWTGALVIAAVASGVLSFPVGVAIFATNLALSSWCIYDLKTRVADLQHRLYQTIPQPT